MIARSRVRGLTVGVGLALLASLSLSSQGAAALTPPEHSMSLGNASDGRLLDGKSLPARGPGFRVMPATIRRGYTYGTDELVGALTRGAASVASQFPGSVLLVANMSRQGGGDIGPSVSHNSGRDADLGFYASDAAGRSADGKSLVVFDADGVSGALRFDVKRNWALVRALLTDDAVQVQWIFCKAALREKLLDYARRQGEPADLITRADGVLGEPGNSSAHSEHFHVRLYCARHERLEGCLNYGPTHAWVDDFHVAVSERTAGLVKHLHDAPAGAIAAIGTLAAIRGTEAVSALAALVAGPAPATVKLAAIEALGVLDSGGTSAAVLATALAQEKDRVLRSRLVRAIAAIADVRTAPALLSVAAARSSVAEDRLAALDGLGRMLATDAVPGVAAMLGDSDKAVARAADDTLLRITNRSFGLGKKAPAKWAAWWKTSQGKPRIEWVRAAFDERHVRLHRDDSAGKKVVGVRKLVAAMRKGGPISVNARALIADVTGFSMTQGHFTDFQMFRFYNTWVKNGGAAHDIATPTPTEPTMAPNPTGEP